MQAMGITRPPIALNKAKLTLTRFSSMKPDQDGLVSSFKHVVDGLVECGVLVDDSMDIIGMPEYKHEPAKPKFGKIQIEVQEIE